MNGVERAGGAAAGLRSQGIQTSRDIGQFASPGVEQTDQSFTA
jgi:hypothetical protein